MLVVSWMLLLTKLHDLSVRHHQPTKQFMLTNFGIPIIGILGILLVAKQRSLIPQVQPVMDALINQAGFRISPRLYQRILSLSQEP
jgi:predicted nucleic acid-binding protein